MNIKSNGSNEYYLGGEEVANMFIARGADVNSKDIHGFAPIHMTGEFGAYISSSMKSIRVN